MTYKVLVVDDSQFIQHRLVSIVEEHPSLKVVGVASNGYEAIDLAAQLKPDVITMDFEMPQLDGISAIKGIKVQSNIPIIMFSSLTYEGARVTIDALAAGAVDFINKDFSQVSGDAAKLKKELHSKLVFFAQKYVAKSNPASTNARENSLPTAAPLDSRSAPHRSSDLTASASPKSTSIDAKKIDSEKIDLGKIDLGKVRSSRNVSKFSPKDFDVVVIGASTGGPVAVSQLLETLPGNFPLPIVVIQHMPANFTKALAARLDRLLALSVKEAAHADMLSPGRVYIAPGGQQLMFENVASASLKVVPGDERMNYKPSVDIAFASAANKFGRRVMGIVMTGMGSDGCDGARILKQKGGTLWSQDETSCVVYGMPKAVVDEGLTDAVMSPLEIGTALGGI